MSCKQLQALRSHCSSFSHWQPERKSSWARSTPLQSIDSSMNSKFAGSVALSISLIIVIGYVSFVENFASWHQGQVLPSLRICSRERRVKYGRPSRGGSLLKIGTIHLRRALTGMSISLPGWWIFQQSEVITEIGESNLQGAMVQSVSFHLLLHSRLHYSLQKLWSYAFISSIGWHTRSGRLASSLNSSSNWTFTLYIEDVSIFNRRYLPL